MFDLRIFQKQVVSHEQDQCDKTDSPRALCFLNLSVRQSVSLLKYWTFIALEGWIQQFLSKQLFECEMHNSLKLDFNFVIL